MVKKIRIHETEKSHLVRKEGYIVFIADKNATKEYAKSFVEQTYDVKVQKVTSVKVHGKRKVKNRKMVTLADKKKFYVRVDNQAVIES